MKEKEKKRPEESKKVGKKEKESEQGKNKGNQ